MDPLLQLDDQIDLRLKLDRTHAKQLLHVNETDAADFNIVLDNLRCGAHQGRGHPADLHRVVCHQPVTTLKELDGSLTFTDAGIAQDQHALSVYVHQHTVAGDLRCQGPVQIVDDTAGNLHRSPRSPQQRPTVGFGDLQQLRKDLHVACHDQRRDLAGEKLLKDLAPTLHRHGFQIGHLRPAQDLQAFGLKIVVKAHQLQRRTVHVQNGDLPGVVIRSLQQDLQSEGLHQIAQLRRGPSHLFFHNGLLAPREQE